MTPTTDLQKLLDEATRGPWELRTVSIPHYLQNERSPKPHYDRSIYTAWEHPQLKDCEPVVVIATGVPEVKGDAPVLFLHIDEVNARLIAMAPDLAARVLELEAENKRLREGLFWIADIGFVQEKHAKQHADDCCKLARETLGYQEQARTTLKGGEI